MAKRKYDDMFLKPEITQAGEYQVFTMKGKDSRGFDWKVMLAPITEKTYPAQIPRPPPPTVSSFMWAATLTRLASLPARWK